MKALPWILFAVTLAILLLVVTCNKSKPRPGDETTVDVKPQPPETTYLKGDPVIVYRDTFKVRNIGRVDTFPLKIPYPVKVADSLCQMAYDELYAAYTTQNEVHDGYPLGDSLGYVYITDTIAANQLIGRKVTTQLNTRVISKDTVFDRTIEKARVRLLLGGGVTGNKTGVMYLTANAGLKDRRDNVYLVGAYQLGSAWVYELKFLKSL